ncbi:MAG: 5'-methylthioadenosine/S-adenosylhomocysteine nucleosidase, partial [Bacilli bacterium]
MILIIAAMEEEFQALEELMYDKERIIVKGIQVTTAMMDKHQVVLIKSGVGKVNAAYTTTTILNEYPIDLVINIGSAAGINQNVAIKVLDLIIASKVCYHDVDLSAANRPYGKIGGLPIYFETAYQEQIKELFKEELDHVYFNTIASGDQFINNDQRFKWINDNFKDVV